MLTVFACSGNTVDDVGPNRAICLPDSYCPYTNNGRSSKLRFDLTLVFLIHLTKTEFMVAIL